MSESPTLASIRPGGATDTFRLADDRGTGDGIAGKVEAESGKSLPPVPTDAELSAITEKLNRASRSIGRDLRFEVDLENGRSVIQVLDRETGEIIRQIPPEDAGSYLDGNGSAAPRLYDELI